MKKNKIEDFFEGFANDLKTNPEKLRKFEKAVNRIYKETGDVDVILGALKVIAFLKDNVSRLDPKSKIDRISVYNLFKTGSNPTFRNIVKVSKNLGVDFTLSMPILK
jgi:DNA-binding phage protein